MSKKENIENLKNKIYICKKCTIHKTRNNPVFGEGDLDTSIIFIGEAPGKNEDISGKPFVGKAGKILDEMLNSIGLDRKNVYISNILKCRPPKNRNPLKSEIYRCSIYIDEQIKLINPKLIIPLGRIAISYIFKKFGIPFEKINKIHGKVYSINKFKIIPMYHPAAIIYNKNLKKNLLTDFKIIKQNI